MSDVLVIDDRDRVIELCRRHLRDHRFLGPARGWEEARRRIARAGGSIDVVLLDVHFDVEAEHLVGLPAGADAATVRAVQRRQGFEILRELRARYPDLPVVLMTTRDDAPLARKATELGAEDYTHFLDDDDLDARTLATQIDRLAAARRGELADGPVFWGRSLALRRLRHHLGILARGRLPVVLLGPTGTGKSLIARHVVHPRSGRNGRFVAVDLSTIPAELMAAHLFGARRGAYTGAVADRQGAFEAADGGTLFLDEIGNLSLDAQKMLLTVLQEGTVQRLGDLETRRVDVKLVVATNDDLAARARAGSFRSDLYMRLNPAVAVTLPPLSERTADREALLAFVAERALERSGLTPLLADRGGEGPPRVVLGGEVPERADGPTLWFDDKAVAALWRHDWPGNLRELSMVVENALLFTLAEAPTGRLEALAGGRDDLVRVRPKIVTDLLSGPPSAPADRPDGYRVAIDVHPTLNKLSQSLERQVYETLWFELDGDFGRMAERLLGEPGDARKVQLRFNQLGLKVRELRQRSR